jgi:hypothetical protein
MLLLIGLCVIHKEKNVDLVIARYHEDLSWLHNLSGEFRHIVIYNKGPKLVGFDDYTVVNLPNVGRCDHTYLHHIINNYDNLADVTIFLPGSCDMSYKWPYAKRTIDLALAKGKSVFVGHHEKPEELAQFKLDAWVARNSQNAKANPEEMLDLSPWRPFGTWHEKTFGKEIPLPETVIFYGIFAVSKKDIRKRSLQSYKDLIRYVDHHSNPEAGHYFERAWLSVFYKVSDDNVYSLKI